MKINYDLHPLQEKIIKKLGYSDEKAFSEIKGDVKSNKFAFHIKKLQEKGLIKDTEKGYRLTAHGREILPYFDLEDVYHPIIVVDLLVFYEDKVYLVPKKNDPLDPFQGDYRALSSRISKNDRLEAKAEDIFEKEFGKEPEGIQKCGVFDSQVSFEDGSKQHYLVFYFKIEIEKEIKGDNWFKIKSLSSMSLLPGLGGTIKELKDSKRYFQGKWDLKQAGNSFIVEELSFG